ncbi:unnamed protein product [Orchesella dallaii]|uniref:Uncharacterized protein n=1 Tax=Orchesella dallaii TaxID=48710 RepID=A0ABP1PY43_9HEXA
MSTLSFKAVVKQWEKVNSTVDGHALVASLWTYCRSQAVFNWRKVFVLVNEVKKFTSIFYEENGFVYVYTRDGEKLKRYFDLMPMLTPYFFNLYSQECGFIASLMLKFFDVLYPNLRNVSIEEILGKRGRRACGNFESTSKWCRALAKKDFDENCSDDDEEDDSVSILQVD